MGIADLSIVLRQAFTGHMLVQAWLGYGEVLFAGFGDSIISSVPIQGYHPLPDYELQTLFSTWRISDKASGWTVSSDEDRILAQAGVDRLVGYHVMDWFLCPASIELRIEFEGGLSLCVIPMTDADVVRKDAWSIRTPEGSHWVVRNDKSIYVEHEEDPR